MGSEKTNFLCFLILIGNRFISISLSYSLKNYKQKKKLKLDLK